MYSEDINVANKNCKVRNKDEQPGAQKFKKKIISN